MNEKNWENDGRESERGREKTKKSKKDSPMGYGCWIGCLLAQMQIN